MLSKEAQAACQAVGGYLVEPRSMNKEADLEDVAEVTIYSLLKMLMEILSFQEHSQFTCQPDSVQYCGSLVLVAWPFPPRK